MILWTLPLWSILVGSINGKVLCRYTECKCRVEISNSIGCGRHGLIHLSNFDEIELKYEISDCFQDLLSNPIVLQTSIYSPISAPGRGLIFNLWRTTLRPPCPIVLQHSQIAQSYIILPQKPGLRRILP